MAEVIPPTPLHLGDGPLRCRGQPCPPGARQDEWVIRGGRPVASSWTAGEYTLDGRWTVPPTAGGPGVVPHPGSWWSVRPPEGPSTARSWWWWNNGDPWGSTRNMGTEAALPAVPPPRGGSPSAGVEAAQPAGRGNGPRWGWWVTDAERYGSLHPPGATGLRRMNIFRPGGPTTSEPNRADGRGGAASGEPSDVAST